MFCTESVHFRELPCFAKIHVESVYSVRCMNGMMASKRAKIRNKIRSLFLWQKISISFVIICPCHLPWQPFQCYHSHRWTFSVRTHDLSHNLLLLVCFAGASIFCTLSAIFCFILEFSHPFRGFVLQNNNVHIVPVIPFTLWSFSTIYLVCVTNENWILFFVQFHFW